MATTPMNGNRREPIEFQPNKPELLALKFSKGKPIEGPYSNRVMYSVMDGRVMFLDPPVAALVDDLGLQVGETFFLAKNWSGKRGDPAEWTAWLSPETEKARSRFGAQPNGTFVVPAPPPAAKEPEPPAQVPQTRLEAALMTVVQAVFAAHEHAKRIGYTAMPQFSGEDLRTMANTLMINGEGR